MDPAEPQGSSQLNSLLPLTGRETERVGKAPQIHKAGEARAGLESFSFHPALFL